MSIETAIEAQAAAHTGLNALIAGRMYPDVAAQEAVAPFVVYQRISSRREYAMGPAPTLAAPRFQFTAYASTKLGAIALGVQVLAAFNRWRGTLQGVTVQDCRCEDERDRTEMLDTETQLRVKEFDFIINHTE